ncbi:MAG: glycosyltransferase family 2 protein [Patescibacteria group bacterium]
MTKVSINLITYNRANYLKVAIESVLAQTFLDWELIVVDDCSTDTTVDLIKAYSANDRRIKYFKNSINFGIGKSRNLALEFSTGKYIAVLDSDDYWADNDKLQKQLNLLDSGEYILVGGGCQIIDELGNKKNKYLNPQTDEQIRNIFLIKNPFVNSGVVFLKNAAIKSGGYDESLRVGEDYDLFLKLGCIGKMFNVPTVFVNYRKHEQNVSRIKVVSALEDNITIIRRYKNDYPNYFIAIFRRLFRLFLVKLFFRKK